MSAIWVAGSVRATGLLVRRVDAAALREIATAGSLHSAQQRLTESSYRRRIRVGATLTDTEHALGEETVWRLRVLAGWQPRSGVTLIRLLAGAFEIADITALAVTLAGAAPHPPYELGALTTAWNRVRDARTPHELRTALARTAWGDPGADTPADIADGIATGWATRVATTVPAAEHWALGAMALLTTRRQLLENRPLPAPTARRLSRLLGPAITTTHDLPTLRNALPPAARWALADIDHPADLWRAEFAWWRRLDHDARELLREHHFDASALLATVALLTADAWRVRAALQVAATSELALEDLDELVG